MSKPTSGHFRGTTGERKFSNTPISEDAIIKERTKGLDLREHPVKHKSSLSLKKIRAKRDARTATRDEYKKLDRMTRLDKKRKRAVKVFWRKERIRIKKGLPLTRNWTAEQRSDILRKKTPKINGKSMQGHHTYSVNKYPHLAGNHNIIFPVSFEEHLYYWHGGKFKNSSPGRPFKRLTNTRRNKHD